MFQSVRKSARDAVQDADNTPIIKGSALKALNGEMPELGADAVMKLLAACDEHIPLPVRELDKPFLMAIEDVFSIPGRGTVVTGKIEQGCGIQLAK